MKLYLYKHGWIQTQDTIPAFEDTVPFSKAGIQKHCTVVTDPDEADFLYMGQVSDGNMDEPGRELTEESFTYLPGRELKHILDLEGDWCGDVRYTACGRGRMIAPDWVLKCIKSCGPTKYAHWIQPVMARPHMSELLIFLGHNPECSIEFPTEISFGFRGQSGPLPTRTRVAELLKQTDMKQEILLNTDWSGRKGLDSPVVSSYIDSLYRNLISLCPESTCSSTIRFYESCFFGRVPVIIGEQMVMEEGDYDTSFVYKIDSSLPDDKLTEELVKIYNTPYSELVDKAKAARQYFIDVVMKYFEDPTKYMIDWMKRKGLYTE